MEALTLLAWAFDGLLCLTLLWLAWRALACTDLFKATVLFIAFGLLMALAWVRLEAPDVALAEAAIGAGLTGALLLAALSRLTSADQVQTATSQPSRSTAMQHMHYYLPTAAIVLTMVGLAYVIIALAPLSQGLNADISVQLEHSGVGNPVTAVLLNFRSYDTLLEMIVLLVALMGVWSLNDARLRHKNAPGTLLDSMTRMLTPLLILVSAYLLWVGADAPGGAFQAASVLSAAGVLLLLSGWRLRLHRRLGSLPLRLILLAGPATFLITAIVTTLIQGQLLSFPPAQAGAIILLLEGTATLSIATTLAALFLGGHPQSEPPQQ